MIAKVQEKTKALQLRRQGYSYQDILKEVKVSKSSLSLWLNELPLTNEEESFLKTRKDSNISRGRIRAAVSNRMRRVVRDGFITRDAKREFEE
ncbi:MAG TPA: helix-turn-helix domain-containing protein, partial [Candidatus Paceibacterota bacterium]|nr:helix-turn-helix domain-containing protein [Candidatus Paceibacterota bacterium]